MVKVKASIRAGEIAWEPAGATCVDLEGGLLQRVTLFEAILSDLLGPRTVERLELIPAPLLAHHPSCQATQDPVVSGARLVPAYAAELIFCLDGCWRVRAESTAAPENHAMAQLFEAPALAPFLPGLCRTLLGEKLRLPSIPILWLADRPSRLLWAANTRKWLLHHGFDSPATADGHALASLADRLAWQRRLDSAPWALTASHAWCWSDHSS